MSRIWTKATKDLPSTDTSNPDMEYVIDKKPPGDATDKGEHKVETVLPHWFFNKSAKHVDIKESVAPESNNTRARKPSTRIVPSVTLSAVCASSAVTANTLAGLLGRPAAAAAWGPFLGQLRLR